MGTALDHLTINAVAALTDLADWHEHEATMADAMDFSTTWHDARKAEIFAMIVTLRKAANSQSDRSPHPQAAEGSDHNG